jgi:hypothetical protein
MSSSMQSASLYDDDLLAWSEQQAEALRALARRPELSNLVDWENVVEEIETLGRSDLRALEGNMIQLLSHLIKMASSPLERSLGHWSKDVTAFQQSVRAVYAPSMRQRVDLDRLWRDAFATAGFDLWPKGGRPMRQLPSTCPLSLAELVGPFDLEAALSKIAASLPRKTLATSGTDA